MNSFSKIWIIIIAVIIIGGILTWQYFERSVVEVEIPVEEKQEIIEDETADWKTYRNEEYGFEIRYPENWLIPEKVTGGYQFRIDFETIAGFRPETEDIYYQNRCYVCIDIADNKERFTLETYFEKQKERVLADGEGHVIYFPFADIKPEESFTINDHVFYKVTIPGVIGTRHTFFAYGEYVFNIYIYYQKYPDYTMEEVFEIYEQMLSTFRFLE